MIKQELAVLLETISFFFVGLICMAGSDCSKAFLNSLKNLNKSELTCGNEGGKGDIAMSKFSQAGKYPSLQLIVNHDDGAREFLYSESDSASLKAAAKNKWQVISMKNDWKKIFSDN